MTEYILHGAGTIGRVVARQLTAAGNPPVAFADNDLHKQHHMMEDIPVFSPEECIEKFPDAVWVATAMQPKFREELLKQIGEMGVKSESLWNFMPKRHALPPQPAHSSMFNLFGDQESVNEWMDQEDFRRHPDTHKQRPYSNPEEIYFPNWIIHRDDEHYIDCGAADGDTVKAFLSKWKKYEQITAFEPDQTNYNNFQSCHFGANVRILYGAVADFSGSARFTSTGDYSAHLGGDKTRVPVYKIDALDSLLSPPTYIKMDIEGAELEAIWGARKIIRNYSPVLAICAYHEADHLWQIPLLIHAINPDLKLFLRRYAEGTWETVWYAVPPERVR